MMKWTKKIILGCGAVIVFLVFCVLSLLFYSIYRHDRYLGEAEHSFNALRHPAQTEQIRRLKEVGLLIGNGNHCDYCVGELRSYSGTKEGLARFYARQNVRSPFTGKKQPLDIVFVEHGKRLIGPNEIEIPSPAGELAHMALEKSGDGKYYIVFFLDAGYEVGCDIRCI